MFSACQPSRRRASLLLQTSTVRLPQLRQFREHKSGTLRYPAIRGWRVQCGRKLTAAPSAEEGGDWLDRESHVVGQGCRPHRRVQLMQMHCVGKCVMDGSTALAPCRVPRCLMLPPRLLGSCRVHSLRHGTALPRRFQLSAIV